MSLSKLTFVALLAVGPVACAASHESATNSNVTWINTGRGQYVATATPKSDVARARDDAPYALTGQATTDTRVRTVMRPGIRGETMPMTTSEPR